MALAQTAMRRWPRWYRKSYPWFFIGPGFLVTAILVLAPTVELVRASLKDWQLGRPLDAAPSVGVANFERLFTGTINLGHSLKLTLIYAGSALAVELVLGLAIAVLLDRRIPGMSLVTSALLIPMVLIPAMVGMVWRLYFAPRGLVNYLLSLVGVPAQNWFSPSLALPAVIITDIWEWTPFFVLIFLAGLRSMPQEPVEAATVDGAGSWQQFRLVKLPFLLPLILIAATLRVMELFRQFDVIYVMFAGGPGNATETLPLAIFRSSVQQRNAGFGAAFSIVLIAIILVVAWVFIRLVRRYRVAA